MFAYYFNSISSQPLPAPAMLAPRQFGRPSDPEAEVAKDAVSLEPTCFGKSSGIASAPVTAQAKTGATNKPLRDIVSSIPKIFGR